MTAQFDVFIAGGGPAGCAAAISLARAGYKVCMAESAPSRFKIGESLPPAVNPLLKELGLSACRESWSLVSYGNQSAWGESSLSDTDFIADPNGHGWHVDRAQFDAELRDLAVTAGASVLAGARAVRAETQPGRWLVALSGGQDCEARWLIDCSGRAASFARAQGARHVVYDRLIAVFGIFEQAASDSTPDRDSRTLVESAPNGWWYTSLVPHNRRVVAFHTDAGSDAARLARTPEGFLQALRATRHIRARIEDYDYRPDGRPKTALANTAFLTPSAGPGWFAAGDAAISFDPLSSQGILTALYSGIQAAKALQASAGGDPDAPRRYEGALREVWEANLRNRQFFYNCETRWPERPFWRLRSAPAFGRPVDTVTGFD